MAAGALVGQTLGPIGAFGMNTQTSPLDLPPQFATQAFDCIVDESGQPRLRQAAVLYSSANVDLGANYIARMHRHGKADGTLLQVMSGGTGHIFSSDGSGTVTTRDTQFGLADWQFASLNGKIFAAHVAGPFRQFDESTWAAATISTPSQPTGIHAAYGRLWAIKGSTLYWSDLLDGTNFTTGASGSLDLQKIHTQFRDTAVAVTSLNSQIIVLCRNSLFILGLAADKNPNNTLTPIYLRDFLSHTGCISRDSVVSTGDDVLFLADDGLRSLTRSMTETQGPVPLTDASALNKQYVVDNLINASGAARLCAAWHPEKAWYMVFQPDAGYVWVFDFGNPVPQTRLPRLFIWRMGAGDRPLQCGVWWRYSTTFEGMEYGCTSGTYRMNTYTSTPAYSMTIRTGWLSCGDQARLDAFKRIMLSLANSNAQTVTVAWEVDGMSASSRSITFTANQTSSILETSSNEGSTADILEFFQNLGGLGKTIRLTVTIPNTGYGTAIHSAAIFFKQGRAR